MTSRLFTPWRQRRSRARVSDWVGAAGTGPTEILDHNHPTITALAADLRLGKHPAIASLRAAHRHLAKTLHPVYAVRERQPASVTLDRGRGSCSQRLAVLEALARAAGIPTRAHGLLVDGAFWYVRAGRLRHLVPDQVVLAWPEFLIDDHWVSVSELYGPVVELAGRGSNRGFTNDGEETLFEAVATTAVDWTGQTRQCARDCDLSGWVLADLGRFPSRDALFATHGETFCAPVRSAADVLLSRMRPRP